MKHRDQMQVIGDILRTAESWSLGNRIMGLCNLSYDQLKGYLAMLTEKGLLESQIDNEDRRTYYKTTEKGLLYLPHLKAMEDILQ